MRAWHAGEGEWQGETDINSASIGIEIHNPGHEYGYPDFPKAQLQAIEALCKDIIARHHIRPERVLGHSDVAPIRKRIPVRIFPGTGLRVPASVIGEPQPLNPAEAGMSVGVVGPWSRCVSCCCGGYAMDRADRRHRRQDGSWSRLPRHFRPARVDGRIDHRPSRRSKADCGSGRNTLGLMAAAQDTRTAPQAAGALARGHVYPRRVLCLWGVNQVAVRSPTRASPMLQFGLRSLLGVLVLAWTGRAASAVRPDRTLWPALPASVVRARVCHPLHRLI